LAYSSTQAVVDALSRAAAEPAGLPLFGAKPFSLFTASAPAKKAAQHCKEEGFLRVVRTENRGKRSREFCAITEKGLAYLLSLVSPKQVLDDLVRTLHSHQAQVGELVATARRWQADLDALKAAAEKVLTRLGRGPWAVDRVNGNAGGCNGTGSGPQPRSDSDLSTPQGPRLQADALLAPIQHWHQSGASGDCPLPELFRRTGRDAGSFSIGQFHDELRRLHGQEQIYLHPWTGPLHEIPEPAYALLVGHEIAYYASIRNEPRAPLVTLSAAKGLRQHAEGDSSLRSE
jgi:hypothetical protein